MLDYYWFGPVGPTRKFSSLIHCPI